MLQILVNTPLYVWPLLALLIWGGVKAKKTHIVSWKALSIMPAIMLLWSIYSVATRYAPVFLSLWAFSLGIGIWLGILMTRKLALRFDRQKKTVEIPGNWTPLILSLSIFSLRYTLGVSYGLHPESQGSPLLLAVENCATVVSGVLLGRVAGFWQRSKKESSQIATKP
jgi:hypothetical protein